MTSSFAACAAEPADNPNIILIVTDDQGYHDVGFNGGKEIPTPNIDRIAGEGVRFDRGYVTGPVCGPSRAGFLTGRYQSRFGFEWNPTLNPADKTAGVPTDEKIISEYLKPLGYSNMIVGKWHMGTHPDLRPLRRGFDEFYGFIAGGHNYLPEDIHLDDIANSKKVGDWYHDRLRLNDGFHDLEQYLTDELSDRAVDFVERNREGPFFLYLAYNAPHTPLQATPKYLERFRHIEGKNRRVYAAMISAVDDGVGRVLSTLDRLGITDNTIVIFLSDNGGKLPKQSGDARAADNSPLRGGKGELFDGGIRVPFAIRWPDRIPAGLDYVKPVISLDILATIASQLGIPEVEGKPLDGVDLVPYLNGSQHGQPHDALFWRHFSKGHSAVVQGDTKFIAADDGDAIYDMANDSAESKSLFKARGDKANELKAMHETWNANMASEPAFDRLTSWPPKESKQKKDRAHQ